MFSQNCPQEVWLRSKCINPSEDIEIHPHWWKRPRGRKEGTCRGRNISSPLTMELFNVAMCLVADLTAVVDLAGTRARSADAAVVAVADRPARADDPLMVVAAVSQGWVDLDAVHTVADTPWADTPVVAPADHTARSLAENTVQAAYTLRFDLQSGHTRNGSAKALAERSGYSLNLLPSLFLRKSRSLSPWISHPDSWRSYPDYLSQMGPRVVVYV